MKFASPMAFLLLAVVPLLLLVHLGRLRVGSVRFPAVTAARAAGHSLRQRLRHLVLLLRVAALVLIVVAAARPQMGKEMVSERTKGIAIEMIVDRSGSMGLEMTFGRKQVSRLDAVKAVFEEFVLGDDEGLEGRPNDMIGLVAFARYADTLCPLTLSHGALIEFLRGAQVVKREEEDGTSIGDALALAAARLKTAEESLAGRGKGEKPYEIKSKIIILLTDGQSNAGKRAPLDAAKMAAEWGIKVYTIGVGGKEAVATVQTPFGPYKMLMGPGLDEKTLKAVAEATGGIYREAETAEALKNVYQEIDRLERSEIQSVRYLDYRELFWPFALSGLALLLLEVVLGSTIFRRIP